LKDEVDNNGVKEEARSKIISMRKHQHFIHDDYQRWGYDNFLSGYESAFRLLTGEKI